MSLKQSRFIERNRVSPVVYLGASEHSVTFRLLDGSSWCFGLHEARELGVPHFAHLEAA